MKLKLLIVIAISTTFMGCSTKVLEPTQENNSSIKNTKVITKTQPDFYNQNVKKAVVVLIKKIGLLEKEIKYLKQNSHMSSESSSGFDATSINKEIASIKIMLQKEQANIENVQKDILLMQDNRYSNVDKNVSNDRLNSSVLYSSFDKKIKDNSKKIDNLASEIELNKKDIVQISGNTPLSITDNSYTFETYAMVSSGKYTAGREVIIRNNPVVSSREIGTIKNGSTVEFTGCDKFGWCKLKNKKGYVSGTFFHKKSRLNYSPQDNDDTVISKYLKDKQL